jgi:hypothetical protein
MIDLSILPARRVPMKIVIQFEDEPRPLPRELTPDTDKLLRDLGDKGPKAESKDKPTVLPNST